MDSHAPVERATPVQRGGSDPGAGPEQTAWLEALPVAALCVDAAATVVAANRMACALLACDEAGIAGRDLRELYRADSRARIDAIVGASAQAQPHEFNGWLLRGDRRSVAVQVRAARISSGAAPVLSLHCMQPRAPHQQLDDAFGDFERRFGRFLDIVDVWIFGVAPGLRSLLHSNRRYGDIWGGTLTELQADPASVLTYVDAADRARAQALFGTDRAPIADECDLRITHPGRGARIARVRVFPVRHDDGSEWLYGTAEDVTQMRTLERERFEQVLRQRDVLVREVHHRIKNNLQGVAGLLRQGAARRPEIASLIDEVASQIHAIAQVHGLQVGANGLLGVHDVARAVFDSVGRNFGIELEQRDEGATPPAAWLLNESEGVPLALVVNELATNAIKHRGAGEASDARVCARVGARFRSDPRGVVIDVWNQGRLPQGFAFDRLVPAPSGLGLIRSLLPRRGARLGFSQEGDCVCARLELGPPAIRAAAGQDAGASRAAVAGVAARHPQRGTSAA